jgi:serine/threonine protein kinase
MEKFQELKSIGGGSFGLVIKARDTETQELFAIKKMK